MDRHHILRDWLDTPRMTLDASGAVAQAGDYYPYGRAMDQRSHTAIPEADRYRFTGHEHDAESGYDYHGARYYQAEVGRYLGVDVMAVEMPEWSSFRYGLDNPIMYIDPTGKSETTFVEQNEDGTYKVVNGVDDGNNSIVLIRDNKFVAVIGFSATPESFYFSGNEGEAGSWQGTIDPNDQSGRNFLNTEILQKNPLLFYYMPNATGGKYYDFKVTNGSNQKIETLEGHYRGMPILGEKNGLPIFASARDIGNIAAGLVAGRHGMDWTIARLGFDALESWQKGELATEASGTQYAQKLGWRIGRDILEKSELSRLPGNGHLRNIEISSDLIYKGDL